MTRADIFAAVEWLESGYEGRDETAESLGRVAKFLRAELRRRQIAAEARRLARRTGATYARARVHLARAMAGAGNSE